MVCVSELVLLRACSTPRKRLCEQRALRILLGASTDCPPLCFAERMQENLVTSAQWEVFLSHHPGALQQPKQQRRPQQVHDVPKAAVSISCLLAPVAALPSHSPEPALRRLCAIKLLSLASQTSSELFSKPVNAVPLPSSHHMVGTRHRVKSYPDSFIVCMDGVCQDGESWILGREQGWPSAPSAEMLKSPEMCQGAEPWCWSVLLPCAMARWGRQDWPLITPWFGFVSEPCTLPRHSHLPFLQGKRLKTQREWWRGGQECELPGKGEVNQSQFDQ